MTEFDYSEIFEGDDAQQAFEDGYRERGSEHSQEVAELKREIASLELSDQLQELDNAAAQGEESVWAELEAVEQAELQAEQEWDSAVTALSDHLDRPISEAQAAKLWELVPDAYTPEDLARAAAQIGLGSFTGQRARSQRVNYLDSRMQELAADD